MQFTSGDWRIDILIQGYPGKSTQHGGLGWSTVALLRGHGRIVVLDGGGYGMRKPLVEALAKQGVKLSDVTDLLISHLHHDHVVNWPMFRDARIHVGRKELAWALGVGWGETAVPEHAVEALSRWPTMQLMDAGQEVLPGITAHLSPGHTPGHLLFLIKGAPQDVVELVELMFRDVLGLRWYALRCSRRKGQVAKHVGLPICNERRHLLIRELLVWDFSTKRRSC